MQAPNNRDAYSLGQQENGSDEMMTEKLALILNEYRQQQQDVDEAARGYRDRGFGLLQTSGLLLAVIGILIGKTSSSSQSLSLAVGIFLAASLTMFMLMFYYAIGVWSVSKRYAPLPSDPKATIEEDTEELRQNYVNLSIDELYGQLIKDTLNALKKSKSQNIEKTRLFENAERCFGVMLLCLLISVIIAVFFSA